MRQIMAAFAVVIALSLVWSCATMNSYEYDRQVRLGLKPNPSATPSPTPNPSGKPETIVSSRAEETPVPQPLDKSVGTLFHPWTSAPPRDAQGEDAKKSAELAESQVEESRPATSIVVAPGPIIPVLKTLLRSTEDLTVVSRVYQAYAEAVHAVRVSVDAYGIKPNLDAIRRLRGATDYWQIWFSRMHIYPESHEPNVQTIQDFYKLVGENGQAVQSDIGAINAYIDKQRTIK